MPASRARVGVIFLTVLIDLIGFGIVIPILPYYAQRLGAGGFGLGMLLGAFSLMQFLATAILGKLSDRVGRRPIILATTLINAAGYAVFAFAGSYAALFVSRVVSGLASGNISAAQAYMADITPPQQRSRGMGLVGAAFGIGFTIGPLIGGLAHAYIGPSAPGLVAMGLSLLNFGSAYVILAESLHHELRVSRPLFDFAHIAEAFARPLLRPLMTLWFLVPFAFAGYTAVIAYLARANFAWGERELGVFFTVIGITAAVVQGYLFGKFVRRTGERALVIIGTFGMALAIGVVPFAASGGALYAWTFALAFSNSIFAPGATGLVSVYADVKEQGTVLGAAQAVGALGRTLGPPLIGAVYDRVTHAAAFYAAAGVMLLAGRAALGLKHVTHAPAKTPEPA